MRAHLIFHIAMLIGAVGAATIPGARGSVTILGGGLPESCSKAARGASDGAAVDSRAIELCTLAIEGSTLTTHDLAGTYTNRGILYLTRSSYADARRDFDIAVSLDPKVGEAYVNRGAALIGERRFADGLTDIDRGLALGPEQPEKAYFNRGLAHEYLDDLKNAYLDYRKASELKPDWEAPKRQLDRFTVSRRPKS